MDVRDDVLGYESAVLVQVTGVSRSSPHNRSPHVEEEGAIASNVATCTTPAVQGMLRGVPRTLYLLKRR